ncbi:MAG: hypothetical protein AABW88_05140 [Nanoarchaeota archaeon]
MKWLWSFLAFIFAAMFVTAITTNAFISSINSGYENAKYEVSKQVDIFSAQNIPTIYAQNPELKASIDALNALPPDVKKQTLEEQCKDKSEQPFCDEGFISGELTFDEVLKKKTKEQFEPSFLQALDEVKNQMAVFNKFPLTIISVISAILGVIFYMTAHGMFKGFQVFSGNVSWLSFLSAASFKFMPNVLNKVIANMQQNVPAGSESISALMTDILFSWLTPAINNAFMFSIYLAALSFILWIGIKLFRKYSIGIT